MPVVVLGTGHRGHRCLVFGTVRLVLPTDGQTIKVGLVAFDEAANVDPADPGLETERLLRAYVAEVAKLAAQGPR